MTKRIKSTIIFVSIGILILSAVFIPLTFFVFLKPRLNAPSAPSVILTESRICATTSEVENAKSYVFKFTSPNSQTIEIISTTPTIYININENNYSNEFEYAGVYQVKCCVVGEKESSRSAYSPITEFEKYVKLTKPSAHSYTSNSESIISWESIKNADLYDIYITSSTLATKFYTYTPLTSINIETISLKALFVELEIPFGNYEILIIAKNSTNPYFLQSLNSDPISFNYSVN